MNWTGGREVPTLFSDGYPLLVLSEASIADLSARVGEVLPVQRFRPNLLLGGSRPMARTADRCHRHWRRAHPAHQGLHAA